jgi:hypothetical protein
MPFLPFVPFKPRAHRSSGRDPVYLWTASVHEEIEIIGLVVWRGAPVAP